LLTQALMIGALVTVSALATPTPVHGQACPPVAVPPRGNVDDPSLDVFKGAFATGADVIRSFNFARQREGCEVSLSIDPAAYDAASPQQQALMVVNAE